jgi:acetyl-CoA carboxylase biotin carboxyl carrier protein
MGRIPIDTAEIRALAEILADTGLTEIEVADGDSRIRVARTPAPVAPQSALSYAPPAPGAAPTAPQAPPAEPVSDPAHEVTSPMVGVAFLSPEPGQPQFVVVGQPVTAGQTVLLIEAMKTFNQIKAPKAGTVKRILVASGQPVEYGEVLLVIE